MMKPKRNFFVLGLAGGFFIFWLAAGARIASSAESAYEQIRLLVDILDHVQSSYVEDVQLKELIYGAAHGIVRTLDPFSQFLPPQALSDMKIETEGEFGGIGIRVHVSESGWLTVITPLPGTPAFKAGVFPQDKIVRIDGVSTEGITIEKAVHKLRGKPGTKVVVTVAREEKAPEGEAAETLKDIELIREQIKIQTIYSRMVENTGIGYLHITEFNAQTPRDVHTHMTKLSKEGMRGLILDLRFNPGGLLPSAIETVKEFVGEDKLVVYTQGRRAESRVEYRAATRAPFAQIPLAVLVNEGSASGSEIVAGALKDHHRAKVIGSRTFGKGSVQSVITLADSSGLRLTTAYYYTPSGRLIHKRDFRRKKEAVEEEPLSPEEEVLLQTAEAKAADGVKKTGEKPAPASKNKPDSKPKKEEEIWGIDPDIEVKVPMEVASKVRSSFDLVYFPDNRPSVPIREMFKKEQKQKDSKPKNPDGSAVSGDQGQEGAQAKPEEKKEEVKPEEPARDEVLDKAIEVLQPLLPASAAGTPSPAQ